MKAEDIVKSGATGLSLKNKIMTYAHIIAKEALVDAAENAVVVHKADHAHGCEITIDKDSIINTKIKLK